ncbi:MAG: hypothetical protein LBT31_09990 [Synergistaceae bacterium]|jgi:acyl carrier protein|nr:hypothetical protein [Synergistaceae bacterium]
MDGFEGFRAIFANAVNVNGGEGVVEAGTRLDSLDEWDSLGKFLLLSLVFAEYEVNLDAGDVNAASSVGDIWRLIEREKTLRYVNLRLAEGR